MMDKNISQSPLRQIKAIALDVDGVLTDGGMWWGANGEELKRFSFVDIMGVSLARRMGLVVTLISGEASPLVDRYAEKMNIGDVTKGCRDKAAALREFAQRNALELGNICFMGDDINDLEAMSIAGLSAAPADAQPEVLQQAGFRSTCKGGHGAVRDLVNAIIAAHELDESAVWQRRV